MLIDSHSHLNFAAFEEDADEVVSRCLKDNIWMINVGTQYSTSKKAVEIAKKYDEGVFASVGLHPIHLETGLVKIKNDSEEVQIKSREEDFDYEKYKELVSSSKVVAIGEIGLDYWYKPKTKKRLAEFKERQKEIFLKQIRFAKELNLPVIIHCRLAHDEILDILPSSLRGVIHCFTGNKEQAKKYLEKGFYIGLNGIIFKLDLDEVVKEIPLERILIETDCPYLSPPAFKDKRNTPLNVKYIAERIAELKGMSFEEIAEATTKNAKELFKI